MEGPTVVAPYILVADDDPSNREVIALGLTEEGYQVATAADGQEALEAIERERPRVLLLDLRMPVLDGWGVAHELKERALWSEGPGGRVGRRPGRGRLGRGDRGGELSGQA